MIFCEQCGNKLNDNAKFCGKCGTPVTAGQAEIPQTNAPESGDGESPAKKAFNAGMACVEAEQFDEAIAHFSETIRLRPDAADPYAKRGYAYEQKGEHDLAIADYTKALQIAPNSDAAYCLRGLAYSMKGQNDSAIADFSKAIQIDPNEASYYGYRGIAYLSIDDMSNANADLQRGMQIDPNDEMLADLAEALAEEGVLDGMSAPAACTQCGAPLEEGEMFCANCGTKAGAVAQQQKVPVQAQRQAAVPQYQSAPAQTQRQDVGGEILKEGGAVLYITSSNNKVGGIGRLFLYRNRLEWEIIILGDDINPSERDEILRDNPEWIREMKVVIPFGEIESIKNSWLDKDFIDIKMFNKTEYRFLIANHEKINWDKSTRLANVKSWFNGIKSLCPHLK